MPSPFVGAIESLFRMHAQDAATLANELYQRSVRAYEATVNAHLEALGEAPTFRLQNRDELRALRQEAIETARGIAQTYNAELAKRVDTIVESEGRRGLNRATLAKRLGAWDSERSVWKTEQIRQTESSRVAQRAVTAFVEASRLDDVAQYRILPASSSHDDPNDLAARSGRLLTHAEMLALGLPAHPGERHAANLALPEGVAREALWLGG